MREAVWNGQGRRWELPSPCGAVEVGGRGGVTNPGFHPPASAGSPMPRGLGTRRGLSHFGESISPWEGSPNRHPIGLGADGEPRGTGLPRFSNRGKGQWRRRNSAGDGADRRRGLPSAVGSDWGIERTPNRREWAQRGEGGFENSGPRTRISKQLIGGNADELQARAGNGGKRLGEQLSPSRLSSIPAPIGPRGRWGTGGNRPPRFSKRGKGRCRPQRWAGYGGDRPRGLPSAL